MLLLAAAQARAPDRSRIVGRAEGFGARLWFVGPYSVRDALRLPGLVSLARLPLALAFPWTMGRPVLAVSLLMVAGATDILDGWIARRLHAETPTGAVLDAVMDKVFVLVVVAVLLLGGSLTWIETLLLGMRDLGELALVTLLSRRHRLGVRTPRRSNALGKVATVLQFATLIVVLFRAPYRGLWALATGVCGAVAAGSYWLREVRGAGASGPPGPGDL